MEIIVHQMFTVRQCMLDLPLHRIAEKNISKQLGSEILKMFPLKEELNKQTGDRILFTKVYIITAEEYECVKHLLNHK